MRDTTSQAGNRPLIENEEISHLFAGFRSDPEEEKDKGKEGEKMPSYQRSPCHIRGAVEDADAARPLQIALSGAVSANATHPIQRRELQSRMWQTAATGSLPPFDSSERTSAAYRQRREFQAQMPLNVSRPSDSSDCKSAVERKEISPSLCSVLASTSKAETCLARIHRSQTSIQVHLSTSLSNLSRDNLLQSHGTVAIFRHISATNTSLERAGRERNTHIDHHPKFLVDLDAIKLQFATYNIRGLKRVGRQAEISHLLSNYHLDIIGIQETKCSGNTLGTLASGYLLNSSAESQHNKEEHRGTGIAFSKRMAPSIRKIYQGSSRWCGILFLAKPVPLFVLSVYAPTATAETEDKQRFYQEISEIITENGGAMIVILGDFNARILANPGLPRHIGQNIFDSSRPLGDHSEAVLENRDLFLDFLVQHDLVALNTLKPGPPITQITHRNPGQPNITPPWDENNFAQLDYILTKCRWSNQFSEATPRPEMDYDSDHLPVTAKMCIHWFFGTKANKTKTLRHNRTTTVETRKTYNQQLQDRPLNWTNVQDEIMNSSKNTRGIKPPEIRKPFLKDSTIDLLAQRNKALETGDTELSRLITAQFRRQVKKDRKEDLTIRLRTFMGHQQNWPAIKGLRKPFIPRFSKRGTGRSCLPAHFPNDCARYFASEHWKPLPPQLTACAPPIYPETMEYGQFTIEELNTVIDSLKTNKAGGPDELISEMFKDLDDVNRPRLLQLYNEIYHTEHIPDHFNEALVVQLYKTGKTPELYSSYRPIALLNVTYKIFAKLLQNRLREALDNRIVDFQYGYRQGRSTAEPIFIARRTQELAERHGRHLYILALDYAKAFDSIPHGKLLECLQRLGAPTKLIKLVAILYREPRFRIKIIEGISDEFRQATGIRQGCPLSPYLYIIATTCLMLDLLRDLEYTDITSPQGTTYPLLLFADDTLLLTDTAKQMTHLLALIIQHSEPYNLTLNKPKCQLLVTNDVGSPVHFPDSSPVSKHDQIKYLGATFSATVDVNAILRQKITDASANMRLLQPLWADTHISVSWKLVVYNAVIRTKVFYTLETLALTEGQQSKLDTLYFRGLRRILKKKSTFIDRYWTHARLLRLANTMSAKVAPMSPKHISFKTYYLKKRRTLLGHLIRAPPNNLSRLAVLSREDADLSASHSKKRVGRPRKTWLQETLNDAWATLSGEQYNHETDFPILKDLALRRTAPF